MGQEDLGRKRLKASSTNAAQPTQSVRFRPDYPRQPPRTAEWGASTSGPIRQEMDIFEQQEMSKSRPQVKSKLNDWYDWLVNHVPKAVKDKAC